MLQIVHVQKVHAGLTKESDNQTAEDDIRETDAPHVPSMMKEGETHQDGDQDDPAFHEEAERGADGKEPVFESDQP
jgi:hypothetical protein